MLRSSSSLRAELVHHLRVARCSNVRHITTNTAIARALSKPSIPLGAERSSKPRYSVGSPSRAVEGRGSSRGGRRSTRSTPRDDRSPPRDSFEWTGRASNKKSISPIAISEAQRRSNVASKRKIGRAPPAQSDSVRYYASREKALVDRTSYNPDTKFFRGRDILGDRRRDAFSSERFDEDRAPEQPRSFPEPRYEGSSRSSHRGVRAERETPSKRTRPFPENLEIVHEGPTSRLFVHKPKYRSEDTEDGYFGHLLDGVRGKRDIPQARNYKDDRQETQKPHEARALLGEWDQDSSEIVTEDRNRRATSHSREEDASYSLKTRTSEPIVPPRESARAFVVPRSIPYTTAASEFLYGYSVVLAAIKAHRRKLYKIYIHPRAERNEGYAVLDRLAGKAGINIEQVDDSWLPLMDKMSSGRPHNGCIVEASPLPRPPIASLGAASMESNTFRVTLSHQSREDADINGSEEYYSYPSSGWRHPFVLYADGVTDEGNLGGIIRAAYFLGVDAIALPTRTSAPLTHVALKASVGAAEAIPIFAIADPTGFMKDSSEAGWRIYASDAPTPIASAPGGFGTQFDLTAASVRKRERDRELAEQAGSGLVSFSFKGGKPFQHAHPLARHPTILMLGSEGSGIKSSLMARAHFKVGIRGARLIDEVGVDSLNVSTAAAVLCGEFMRRPPAPDKSGEEGFLF